MWYRGPCNDGCETFHTFSLFLRALKQTIICPQVLHLKLAHCDANKWGQNSTVAKWTGSACMCSNTWRLCSVQSSGNVEAENVLSNSWTIHDLYNGFTHCVVKKLPGTVFLSTVSVLWESVMGFGFYNILHSISFSIRFELNFTKAYFNSAEAHTEKLVSKTARAYKAPIITCSSFLLLLWLDTGADRLRNIANKVHNRQVNTTLRALQTRIYLMWRPL